MQRRLFLGTALSLMSALVQAQDTASGSTTPTTIAGPASAGKVDLVEGDVRFLDRNRQMRRPKVGDMVNEGDSIVTGKDGEVHLNMEDGGYIGVRPDTRMRIAVFKADGGPDDRSVIGLLSGSFRSVTGWIGKLSGNHYRINTPTATIGVRGTDHEPMVIPEGGAGGEPGTYDRVHVGETRMQTPQGSISVKPNQAGFTSRLGGAQPRVLDRIPDSYRATRNEGRFQGTHDRVQQQLETRREQRRQSIQEHKSQTRQEPAAKKEGGAATRREPAAKREGGARELERPGRAHGKGPAAHKA